MEHEMIPTLHGYAQLPDTGWQPIDLTSAPYIDSRSQIAIRRVGNTVFVRPHAPLSFGSWVQKVEVPSDPRRNDAMLPVGFHPDGVRVGTTMVGMGAADTEQPYGRILVLDSGAVRLMHRAASTFGFLLTYPTSDPWPVDHPPIA